MLALLKWLISGLAGAALGTALWVLVASRWDWSLGLGALLVGFLAGITVRLSSRYDQTPPTRTQGVIASLCTLTLCAVGLFMIASLRVDRMLETETTVESTQDVHIEPDQLVILLARDEAHRRMEGGETLAWPAGKDIRSAVTLEDFPPEIVTWADEKHTAMTPQQRTAELRRREQMVAQLSAKFREAISSSLRSDEVRGRLRRDYLLQELIPKNILWCLIAIVLAYLFSIESRRATKGPQDERVVASGEDAGAPGAGGVSQ